MGQYHLIANVTKKEYISGHHFGDGIKLLEFGSSGNGTMFGLAVLLAASNKGQARGGGDLHPWIAGHGAWDNERVVPGDPAYADLLMNHVVGRWAGDKIAIIGDYFEAGDVKGLSKEMMTKLWDDEDPWVNISDVVVDAIDLDYYVYTERHTPDPKHNYVRAGNFSIRNGRSCNIYPDGTITRVPNAD